MRFSSGQAFVSCLFVSLLLSFLSPSGAASLAAQDAPFVRGDANQNGNVELGDAVSVILHLFKPPFQVRCEKAADINDSGSVDISDAIYALNYLFLGGAPPPPPTEICGLDPTPDGLGCADPACADPRGSFIISEIMASNLETIADLDGDSSDWIEIQMQDSAPAALMDLGGWYLTDDPRDLTQWMFPEGVVLARGGFLLIFASGKDRASAGFELHTNFKLDGEGEYVALVAPDGVTVVDELAPAFPEQIQDVSYGLVQTASVLVPSGGQALYRVPAAADAGLGHDWAQAGFTPSGWETGTLGFGFSGAESASFNVTIIKANVTVDDLSVAEEVASDPGKQSLVVKETAPVVDYLTTGDSGNYAGDNPFPGIGHDEVEDFVVLVTGKVVIPQTGSWTFGVNSDDGFKLEMTDGENSYTMEHATPRGPSDTLRVFNILRATTHDVRLLYFQQSGSAEVELFASRGARLAFNATYFRLVGDAGQDGIGHQNFADEIQTDLAASMQNSNASLWIRIPFNVVDASQFGDLTLRMKYADGFVAYLNGQEVARRNAPSSVEWDSSALSSRTVNEVLIAEEIDLTYHLTKLADGANVLAIQGLNDAAPSDGFLISPELVATSSIPEQKYMSTPTPGEANKPGAVDFVRRVTFSVEHGFFDAAFSLALSSPTAGAQIRYTLDGATPTATTGLIYGGPIAIGATSVVRAAAFKPNCMDSQVTTRSYIFAADVIRQSPAGQAPGAGWPTSRVNGQVFDYGMDPDIVNSARWGSQVEGALLAIPSISLVTDLANLFGPSEGIYVNASNDGRAWERRTSVELIHPDGAEGFAMDAGLRIRGAVSRSDSNPKHAFRLFFRNEYGAGKLNYPLFGGEGVDEFDQIDLRTSQNYSWAFDGSNKNTLLRDVFSRDCQRDMGQPYTRSRYYHLYINGHYWGLYQTQERANADFAASYLGGKSRNYDSIKNDSSGTRALQASDGTMDAYRRLYDAAVAGFSTDRAFRKVLGLLADGASDPAGEVLVDPENLMDYMICTYFTGDPDAPVSCWGHFSNNVFAVYNRVKPAGFTWYRHDAEHSLGANGGLNEGRLLTDPVDRTIGQQWQHFNPAWLHLRLTQHPEYLLAFADRVNKCFSSGGLLSPEASAERWAARAAQIEQAIIAESARWGDAKRHPALTKDDWQAESNWVVNTFFPQRTQIVLNQMRSVGMFPDAALVSFNHEGGEVPAGFQLLMTQGNGESGTIHYTLDGSDPREWGGAIHPSAQVFVPGSPVTLSKTATVRARVRGAGGEWGAATEARFTVGLEGLVINELMASNSATLEDPDEPGEFPDWLEVYNGTGGTIDLGGMYLSDDPARLDHWQIAQGVSMEPGEFLVFYLDDDGTQGPLHANFQLSRSGETISLVDADGKTIIDSIAFDVQQVDVSYGRYEDGAETLGFHQSPTPGRANTPHVP